MTPEIQIASATQPQVYTVPEVADMLRVNAISVYRMLQRGVLKSCGGLRHKRIARRELERYLGCNGEAIAASKPLKKGIAVAHVVTE